MLRKKPNMKTESDEEVKFKKVQNSLNNIDKTIRNVVSEIINKTVSDKEKINTLYLKTEYKEMTYNLIMYSSIKKNTVGKSWTIVDLLEKCSGKEDIIFELNKVIKTLLFKLEMNDLRVDHNNIHWI